MVAASGPRPRRPLGRRAWLLRLLFVACGAAYLVLGASASGTSAVLGVGGALLVWAALALAPRRPRAARIVLVVGAVPLGVVAWWSVAAPALAAATLLVGIPGLRAPPSYRP